MDTGLIKVNPKKNKDKREMSDSLYHELAHLKYPKASEKKVRLLARNADKQNHGPFRSK